MRSDVIRAYKTVHTWTGLCAGLLLFIAFYAGAITMFKDALSAWTTPPAAATAPAVPIDQAGLLIERTLAAYPAARPFFTLTLVDAGHARLGWQPAAGQQWNTWLDPQGRLHAAHRPPSDAAIFIDVLHMTAGIPGTYAVGMGVMGVVALLYGLALVSGVIVLLPTLLRDLFALRIGRNLKRMWLDTHNALGVLSLPFHVVMALSVVAFGLGDTIFAAQDSLIYAGTLKPMMQRQNAYYASAPSHLDGPGSAPRTALLPPEQLLANVRERAPHFVPATLSYRHAGMPGATVFVGGRDPRYLARAGGFALLDPVTGTFLNAEFLPGNGNRWSAATSAFYALHFGSYGGAPVRWAYCLLGLAGAFLFYSGNLLWLESRRKAARAGQAAPGQTRASLMLAALTVGVTLGCMCGISSTLAAGKLLAGHVANLHDWHIGVYYSAFLGCIAWALIRGAARAAVELLALTTAATAAIPLASLIGWLAPATGLWGSASADALGVDLGAALGALCLAWMTGKTYERTRSGGSDSVWSVEARQI